MTAQTTQFRGVPDSPPPPKRRPKPYPRTFVSLDEFERMLRELPHSEDPYLSANDPEEQRRANTVASDGGQCMIYRRSA